MVSGASRQLPSAPTLRSLWAGLVDMDDVDRVLSWPPDVFALVDRVLDASEGYRFVTSPPQGLTSPVRGVSTASRVAKEWWAALDRGQDTAPDVLIELWSSVRNSLDVPIEALSRGDRWNLLQDLITLYAVADEACAGLGSAAAVEPGPGCRFRAAARELLA